MNVVGEGASSTLEFVIPMFVLEINACKNPIFLVDVDRNKHFRASKDVYVLCCVLVCEAEDTLTHPTLMMMMPVICSCRNNK